MTYYRYLTANLKFPFFTSHWAKSGPFTRKKDEDAAIGKSIPMTGLSYGVTADERTNPTPP